MGERSEPTGIGAERRLSLRGGTEPAPYQGNRSSAVYGGVRSPRPTEAPTGRCGHRPLRIEGEATSTTWGSGAERSVCGADGRNEEESEQRSPPKGPATPDNPSVSLRGTGARAAEVVGPYGTKWKPAATTRAALSEAESAEREAGQIQSLPDDLRVQHGAEGSEVSAKPRPCPRRGCITE